MHRIRRERSCIKFQRRASQLSTTRQSLAELLAHVQVQLAMYFPMPFVSSVSVYLVVDGTRISLHDDGTGAASVSCSIGVSALDPALAPLATYFHGTYKDTPVPVAGEDVVMLDTQGLEGEPNWSGHLIGTVVTFSHEGHLSTLEGDPRFFFDNSRTPQVQGTGAEGRALVLLRFSCFFGRNLHMHSVQGLRSGVVVAITGRAGRSRLCRLWVIRTAWVAGRRSTQNTATYCLIFCPLAAVRWLALSTAAVSPPPVGQTKTFYYSPHLFR